MPYPTFCFAAWNLSPGREATNFQPPKMEEFKAMIVNAPRTYQRRDKEAIGIAFFFFG